MSNAAAYRSNHDIRPVEAFKRGGNVVLRLQCKQCGGHQEASFQRAPPPEKFKSIFEKLGWTYSARPICPTCNRKKEQIKMTALAKKPEPKTDASAKAKDAMRLAIMALDEAYDSANSRYKAGNTDATIAKETGLSVGQIAELRDKFCGPAGEPDEVAELRQKVAQLEAMAADYKARFNTLCLKHGWAA